MAQPVAALQAAEIGWKRASLLTDVSLEFTPGTFTVITGGPGSGKSLLLRTLWGGVPPRSGSCISNGAKLTRSSKRAWRCWRRQLGIVADDFPLFSHWSVFDNLAVALASSVGLSRKVLTNRVFNELRAWGLLELRDRRADTLAGMHQRLVKLARAFVRRPKLALLDDPLAGFTAEECANLVRITRHHVLAGTAVCLVTREWRHSLIATDRVFEITDGTLRQIHGMQAPKAESAQAG